MSKLLIVGYVYDACKAIRTLHKIRKDLGRVFKNEQIIPKTGQTEAERQEEYASEDNKNKAKRRADYHNGSFRR
jgi:hypothetical protein